MAQGLSQSDIGTKSGQIISIGGFLPVPWDGAAIPADSLLHHESGVHTGAEGAAALTDSGASFGTDTYNTGFEVLNIADDSSATITDTTDTGLVGTLSGGITTDWSIGDHYSVVVGGLAIGDKIWYQETTRQGGSVSMSAKGVPVITGLNGTHVFNYYLEDITDGSLSSVYIATAVVP